MMSNILFLERKLKAPILFLSVRVVQDSPFQVLSIAENRELLTFFFIEK